MGPTGLLWTKGVRGFRGPAVTMSPCSCKNASAACSSPPTAFNALCHSDADAAILLRFLSFLSVVHGGVVRVVSRTSASRSGDAPVKYSTATVCTAISNSAGQQVLHSAMATRLKYSWINDHTAIHPKNKKMPMDARTACCHRASSTKREGKAVTERSVITAPHVPGGRFNMYLVD